MNIVHAQVTRLANAVAITIFLFLFLPVNAGAQSLITNSCAALYEQGSGSVGASMPSLNTAINEMAFPHPVKPFGGGVGWNTRPTVIMGTEPYSSSLPRNWKGTPTPEWRAITPWFVIYNSEEKSATSNTAVEVRKIQLWYFSKSQLVWKNIVSSARPSWQGNYDAQGGWTKPDQLPAGLKNCPGILLPGLEQHAHGGLPKSSTPWDDRSGRADIGALLALVEHRLVRLSSAKPDDRAAARFLVMAGVDYYPDTRSKLSDLNAAYVPGAGLGQFKLSTSEWQYSTFFVRSKDFDVQRLLELTPLDAFTLK